AHMRVAHRRGNAAVGDDTGEIKLLDAAFAQGPFEARGMERRVCDLLDGDVRRRELTDDLLAPASRREIALCQKRSQRFEMRRDNRLAAAAGDQREQRRDDENS